MFFGFLKRWKFTVGYHLTLWYSSVFILSAVGLFALIYVLVYSTLKKEDRRFVEKYLFEYSDWYDKGGLKEVVREVIEEKKVEGADPFFVRVADAHNQTLYSSLPADWSDFDVKRLQEIPDPAGWIRINSRHGHEVMDVASHRLSDGGLLQTGKSSEDRDKLLAHFRSLFATVLIPMLVLGFSGGAFLAHRTLKPIRQLSSTLKDIVSTGRLKTQVPVRVQGNELDDLIRHFNTMLENNHRLIQGMRDTLDNVAHDLRTPLTRLRGIAEAALLSEDVATCHEALANCTEEADKVITMLKTLMDIAEAESGTLRLKEETLSLNDLFEDVADLYSVVADEKGVQVSIQSSGGVTLFADPGRLRQVLANLLDNAIKYTSSGGHVTLIGAQGPRSIDVIVQDTGIGIPQKELTKIWDRLFRGDASRSQPGLGLGLSFVKAIVEAHGGYVGVTSSPGGGSRFTLSFPLPSQLK